MALELRLRAAANASKRTKIKSQGCRFRSYRGSSVMSQDIAGVSTHGLWVRASVICGLGWVAGVLAVRDGHECGHAPPFLSTLLSRSGRLSALRLRTGTEVIGARADHSVARLTAT